MKRGKIFLLAIIFALLAAGSAYAYLGNLEREAKSQQEYRTIPVVQQYIPEKQYITRDMITEKEVLLHAVHEDAVLDKEKIIGSISKTPFYADEQILAQRIASPGERGLSLSYDLSPGKRAMSINISEVIGVGRMLMPGDRVDVVAALRETNVEHQGEPFTAIVIENVRVLAVGQEVKTEARILEGSTATLELTPQEAQRLFLAEEEGRIRLLLRGVNDTGSTSIPPTYYRQLN